MSRIFRHISANDLRRTRQRQIGEQKEYAAQKLKEWQEAEVERKQIEEAARPYKSNWRRENLREFGEWAPIETSGPTNSTSTTFGYFSGGSPVINGETGQQVTFTYSGLDGAENYPTTVTINQGFGDTFQTAPPPFSQVGVQGYTAKLNPRYKEAQKKYREEIKEWERKKEQQRKDIEATFNKFGTSWKEVRGNGGIVRVGNSYVALINTDSTDFGSDLNNNVRVVRMVPCDPSKPMTVQRRVMVDGKLMAWQVSNAQYSDDVYLQIGKQPKAPIEQEYLMPRRTDFKDVNPQLDTSQEFAQKVDADYMMNARVQDTPEQPSFKYDPSKMEREVAQIASSEDPSNRLSPSIIPKQDAVLSTLQYAFGLYDPNKTRKGGQTKELEKAMLNTIGNSIRRGDTSGRVYGGSDYYGEVENIPAQAYLNNYGYSVDYNKGIVVDDRFNLGSRDDGKTPYTNIGGAFADNPLGFFLNPAAQFTADRLVDLGDTVSKNIKGIDPRDDARAGFPVQYVIPWSRVPANHPAWKLRKKKKEEEEEEMKTESTTWSRLKKHR